MHVKALKNILARLEQMYSAGGATSAAKDMKGLANLIQDESETVDHFISRTKSELSALEEMRQSSTEPEVLADELLAAGTDQRAFEAGLAKTDDAKLSKAGWVTLANRYRNAPSGASHRYKFNSIRQARGAVVDTFIERLEAANKKVVIERLTKWAS